MSDRYELSFWRPNKSNNGAAAIFTLQQDGSTWLKMMPQNGDGERSFDNAASINVKIGLGDIGPMLAVINGQVDGIGTKAEGSKFWSGILHKFGESSTAVNFAKNDKGGYYFGISRKVGAGEPVRMNISLSVGDGQNFRVFLERAAWAAMFNEYNNGGGNDGGEPEQAETPATAPAKPAAAKTSKVSKVAKPAAKQPVAAGVTPDSGQPTDDIPF